MAIINSVNEFLSNSRDFYFYLAVISTIFFVVQFCMAMFGAASHGDIDIDHNLDFDHGLDTHTDASEIHDTDYSGISDINLFSIKSITAFVMFFGWAGFFWGDKGFTGLAIAVVCGVVMMFLTSLVIFLLLKMQQTGNIGSADIVGRVASVYLKIPGERSASGKITVKLQNCSRELRAMADEELPRGTQVIIKEHIQGNCYLVEKYASSGTSKSSGNDSKE
jgi:hypothetical protein